MVFNPEITTGAIGIILTLVTMGTTAIGTLLTIYFKTRTDIAALQLGHASLETGLTDVKGRLEVQAENMRKQDIMLERISTRIELMGAITSLPTELANAMHRLVKQERAQ